MRLFRLFRATVYIYIQKIHFGKNKGFGISEYNKACRKLFRAYIISCPFTSSFFVPFTGAFDTGLVDKMMMVQKEVSCDPA